MSIFSIGNTTAGERYFLTCIVSGTTDTPNITWFGPPNGGPLPSDNSNTRMVITTGSTSMLRISPLQSTDEGNYTCQAIVGTVVDVTSIQVIVQGKS